MRAVAAWFTLGVGIDLLFHGHRWLAALAIVAWLVLLGDARTHSTEV